MFMLKKMFPCFCRFSLFKKYFIFTIERNKLIVFVLRLRRYIMIIVIIYDVAINYDKDVFVMLQNVVLMTQCNLLVTQILIIIRQFQTKIKNSKLYIID